MTAKVLAIGLDAADPTLLDRWIQQGHLKNLADLRSRGSHSVLENLKYHKAETPWTTFLTGCLPEKTGYWAPFKFYEGTYHVEEIEAYDFKEFPPFYALGKDYKVAAFDIPQSILSEQTNGVQVLAWGAHSPQTPSASVPTSLLQEIHQTHGQHPALHRDHGDWWDDNYLQRLHHSLLEGIEKRVDICKDLLERDNWDLFLTIFGETHSAGHDLWYLSQPDHPLHSIKQVSFTKNDPMLEVFEAVDEAIGKLLETISDDTYVVVFAAHGSGNNTTDVTSMFFLPELLYRFSFPGEAIFSASTTEKPVPGIIKTPRRKTWTGEIWQRKCERSWLKYWLKQYIPTKFYPYLDRWLGKTDDGILSPDELRSQGHSLFWQPALWYHQRWHQMKAFAIPSFSEGYIRINLQGREPDGIVAPDEYDALCQELTQELFQLANARTGKPIVKDVVRTRMSAIDNNPKLPDGDLIIIWDDVPTDVVDHPNFGRIGPVPYRRSGSHRDRGFLTIQGPDIPDGCQLATGHGVDLAPTLLNLIGAPIPNYMDGKPLVKKQLSKV